jgi:hypothetical protein
MTRNRACRRSGPSINATNAMKGIPSLVVPKYPSFPYGRQSFSETPSKRLISTVYNLKKP